MKNKIHGLFCVMLALFFMNAGYKKMSSNKLKDVQKEQVIEYIFDNNSYKPPVGYNIVMNTFKQSGFLFMISIFQIIAGALILFPKTRILGLLFLLPIIFNIFFMHVFFDNRMDENIETGILLFLNLILASYYYKNIFCLFQKKEA
tara:strand:- start:44 stop:481 length:438 start_codon:yes stop_codon:yes gene_type:complete